ncbi:3-hydroxybutyrate dehydrogenase [Candidatus Odyssella acanthamoebae]|uniref:3-hydroxybutyrate dehydrogenase n=1 Tax=Candidatus Odyssella acanthamoebae TaxID=91604 RepID=A0A077AVY6_9PROT|nr:3-hydroxybutyrate dehydrogenase [Candidatus Paracaedibacter acanthamoebae]AIK95823.1 3-hydroxybutyrate dehydrogenase [Candidatus Paracaedibacter acanthamoebae]
MSKVALITGSTSGIGLGIAKRLAKAGYFIVLNGLKTPQVENVIKEVKDLGPGEVLFSDADMSNPEQIENMIHMIENRFARIDIVVNNAGIQHVAPIEDFPVASWDKIIAINLSSTFHISRLVIPMMKKNGWGRIINIASAHALIASPFKSAYVAAKHGVAGLTKTIALEVAEANITCNAICPGYVLTPLVEGQIAATAKARGISTEAVIKDVMLGEQPTKEFVKIEEIAELTYFLCADAAASITGTSLSIDGGWVAH